MTYTVKQLVKVNNEKRKQLTLENAKYYENLLVYIRSSFFKDEHATEEVLFEMLDHLLLAQQEGKTAQEVFGKEPKQLADDILDTLPIEDKKSITAYFFEIMFKLLGFYFVIVGIPPMLQSKEQAIHLGTIGLVLGGLIVGNCILIYIVLKALQTHAFSVNKFRNKYFASFVSLFVVIVILVPSIWLFYDDLGRAVQISPYTYFGTGCLCILISYLMQKIRETK